MSDSKNKFVRYIRRMGAGSMLISIIIHVIIGIVATVWVVSSIQPQRKALFKGGDNAPSAVQHPVKMSNTQPKLDTLTKRLSVDTPNSAVSLPDLPTTPDSALSSPSLSTGPGAPGGAGGLKGPLMPMFGFKEAQAGGSFSVRLYDLKQFPSHKPNPDLGKLNATGLIRQEVQKFIKNGWSSAYLSKFLRAPITLFPGQIFVPEIFSEEAPKAFGADQYIKVKPDACWVALYKGRVSPPVSGKFRFVGVGDDILIVRLDGRIVLDAGGQIMTNFKTDRPSNAYDYWSNKWNIDNRGGFVVGNGMDLKAGQFYDIQVVFSDQGGFCAGMILFEQEGVNYDKDSKGNPILPIFRVVNTPPVTDRPDGIPVYLKDGPIWRALPPPAE